MKPFEKILDVPRLIKVLWIILWIMLGIFVIGKLCFNYWYPIVVENEIVISICDYVDDHIAVEFVIGILFYLFSINFWFLSAIRKSKYKNKIEFISLNLLYFIGYILKFKNNQIGASFELLYLIAIPTIYNLTNKNHRVFINLIFAFGLYLIINIWQMNIMFVRNINDYLTNMPLLIVYVMQIDFYIFLILTWLGVNYMGYIGGGWFWSKSTTKLEAMKAEELKKDKPNKELIAKIDKELAKRKEK